MKLNKIKELASKTLKVGKGRLRFNEKMIDESKEAITKQDVRDLVSQGAIILKEKKGSIKKPKRKTRKKEGSIKIKVKDSKRKYMILTRKLRAYIFELRKQEKITEEQYKELRKQIRQHSFRSKAHLKEILMRMKEE